MEVIILAGGLGTRLRSIVNEVPKCMAPVANKPFIWYLFKYLTKYEVSKVILSVGYLKECIYQWITEIKNQFPFEIEYAVEEIPLGTGGGIRLALEKVTSNHAIVLNGDTFFNVNLKELYAKHLNYNSNITLALKPMENFERYGNVKINETNNQILAFEEKKYCTKGFINGGVYLIDKRVPLFNNLPQKFSFETEILQPQCKQGNLYGIVQDGYFIDIGIPDDYIKANKEFSSLLF